MKILRLLALLAFTLPAFALDPASILFSWDYNLSSNVGVTGFQLFTLNNDGTHNQLVADVPLPFSLPIPDPITGDAVFTADVTPDKTGRRDFVAIAVTADLPIFSADSNVVSKVVKPEKPRNLR